MKARRIRTAMIWFCALTFLKPFTTFSSAQSVEVAQSVRGVVKAAARVDLTTDLVAPIDELPFQAGSPFKQGDVLIGFDCGRYAAELRAAKAGANAAWVELKQKRYLFKNGAAGRTEMELASANSARSVADIDAINERMRSCEIVAPFDGRVVTLNTRVAELPTGGEPLMTIIDDSRIEIELVVPSIWLRDIDIGTEFAFQIDETGRSYKAQVERLGAEVDPVSQTIQLYAAFVGDRSLVLAGMSGDAKFDFGDVKLTGAIE